MKWFNEYEERWGAYKWHTKYEKKKTHKKKQKQKTKLNCDFKVSSKANMLVFL